ncbi:MAG TPA: DUF3293 domain-containing protein [Acidimicrobiales bacterium]
MELLSPDDPWASYARTVVVITRPDAPSLVVEAAPRAKAGTWPWGSDQPMHILTAWDPGEARPGEAENRERQATLEADLRFLAPDELWAAVGVDPLSGHREEGVAVRGLGIDAVTGLARRYGQDAIFEWTPREWAIVACRGGRRLAFGWTVAPE